MKLFNVGVLRSATDSVRMSTANDLVQRTLAQHGLVPSLEQANEAKPRTGSPLTDMMARITGAIEKSAPSNVDVPDGSAFTQDTFTCRAGSRSFITYTPASSSKGVTGVVVMLHGCTQTPEDFAIGTGMNALAEKHGFVVVYPAQSRGDNAQSCWNWFSRGDQQRERGEPAILAGMTKQVCNRYKVTRDSTFVAGLSAGAAMAVILGRTYPDVFAAIGAHSGLPAGAANDVTSAFAAMAGNPLDAPVPAHEGLSTRTIVFHGTADATVRPCNGDAIARQTINNIGGQCIEIAEHGHAQGRKFTRTISSYSDGNTILEHWLIDGLGHAWSGGKTGGSYVDPDGPSASSEMIRFFFNVST